MEPERPGSILLVSTGSMAAACREVLASSRHAVDTVSDLDEAIARALDHDVVLHADSPAVEEKRLIAWVRRLPLETPSVVAGIPSGPLSRTLTFAGARETLETERIRHDLAAATGRALRYARALRTQARLRGTAAEEKAAVERCLGAGERIREAVHLASRLARSHAPVPLIGERGSGKDIIAGFIHNQSARVRTAPYVRCMVSALQPDRLHEELRGSPSRAGAFERALGGTLLLVDPDGVPQDERSSLADLVKKTRSGVKLLIACPPDPGPWVQEELAPEMASPAIVLPALRDRPEDLLAAAGNAIDHHAAALTDPEREPRVVGLTPSALAALIRHPWPGNLRELDDTIARAVSRSPGPLITSGDLEELGGPEEIPVAGAPSMAMALDVTRPLTDLGRQAASAAEILAIRRALEITGGNVTHAARLLKVSRVHLQKRMKLFGLRS